MKKFIKWFMGLFKSNGLTPEPNSFKEDWVAEYHKIKDSYLMRDIKVCLMQDGKYKVLNNNGLPTSAILSITGTEKEYACKKAVLYYRTLLKHKRSCTPVSEL